MVQPAEAASGSIFLSPSGDPWSGGRLCLTDSCVTNAVLAINRDSPLSLAAISGVPGFGGGFSIPMSREVVMFLPFIAPLIAFIAAGVAALGF